jgi:uncharacterized membrane protein
MGVTNMDDNEIIWPDFLSKELPDILGYNLATQRPDDPWIKLNLSEDTEDKTNELLGILFDYLPEVKLKVAAGSEDLEDNSLLFRALRLKDNQDKYCLQYLWVFSHQRGAINGLLLFLPWISFLILGYLPMTSLQTGFAAFQNYLWLGHVWEPLVLWEVIAYVFLILGISFVILLIVKLHPSWSFCSDIYHFSILEFDSDFFTFISAFFD